MLGCIKKIVCNLFNLFIVVWLFCLKFMVCFLSLVFLVCCMLKIYFLLLLYSVMILGVKVDKLRKVGINVLLKDIFCSM